MNTIQICRFWLLFILVYTLTGCQQSQNPAAASAVSQPASTANKPPCQQSSTPEPWLYNHHSEWELPGAAVPEIYAAAKKILLEEWRMPDSSGNRSENQNVDYLSALVRVTSALDTSFELSVVKLNEKSCRLAIDAKSKEVPPAQLEEHCSLMYDTIIHHLNTSAGDKQDTKVIWNSNQKMYAVGDYPFDYPVKNVFDAAIQLLEQMHVSKSDSAYDDFAGQIFFRSGNNAEMAIEVKMTDENKCRLTFFSRNTSDDIMRKWSDIFVRRLEQKLTEPQPETTSETASKPKPVPTTYYGKGRSPSYATKIVEYPNPVEKICDNLKDALQQLNINLSDNPQRDALTAKMMFKTANSADWRVTISQMDANRSKVEFSATNIYAEDFEKYTTTIIQNLEKQLQQPDKP